MNPPGRAPGAGGSSPLQGGAGGCLTCFLAGGRLCPRPRHAKLGAGVPPGLGRGSSDAAVLSEGPAARPRRAPHAVHAAHRVARQGAGSHGAAAGVRGVLLGGGHRHEAHPQRAAQRGDVPHADARPRPGPGPCRWACGSHLLTGAGERRPRGAGVGPQARALRSSSTSRARRSGGQPWGLPGRRAGAGVGMGRGRTPKP